MPYSIELHTHRYSAWAASRAASTSSCRFSVLQGKSMIEDAGLDSLRGNPNRLPPPERIDSVHRKWRQRVLTSAKRMQLIGASHGVAAKLINVYLKGVFVCAGHASHRRVEALHPPIDDLLLRSLRSKAVGDQLAIWRAACKTRWSQFESVQYETVIRAIRVKLQGRPMWEIEEDWPGHR